MSEILVDNEADGMRVDVFIAAKFRAYSRSSLKVLFDQQRVFINHQAAKPSNKLKQGDKVSVDMSILSVQPVSISLPVIYEDRNVVIINKPAGVLTHAKGQLSQEPTVASFMKDKLTDKKLAGNRAGVVHRLDRNTSGLIIGAKNERALKHLQKQFAARKVDKTYIAIVEGRPPSSAAIIDAPIGRSLRRRQTFKVTSAGRPAQTEYRAIRSIKKNTKIYSVLELKPITGRTHQIRVHLAYIGHPIVGDAVYGHRDGSMLLHAGKLKLQLPSGEQRTFSVPPPKTFKDFQKR